MARSLILMLFLLPAFANAGKAKVIEFFGYDDAIELRNEHCRVILTPSFGGKVMSFERNGKEAMMRDESESGWLYDPATDNRTFNSGGRFDFGPTNLFGVRRPITIGQWKGEITSSNSAFLTSPKATGIQMTRRFALDESKPRLKITHTIINRSEAEISAFFWTRAFAKGGGIALVPLEGASTIYRNGFITKRKSGELLIGPEIDGVEQNQQLLAILKGSEFNKFGFDTFAGWFTYLIENDLMMGIEYEVYPDRPYIDIQSGTLSIYYNTDFHGRSVAELEPMSPKYILQPGESASFTEIWSLYDYDFPEKRTFKDAELALEEARRLLGR